MKKLTFVILMTVLTASAADRPNVIILITDDQGFGDLSCHGHPILETPAFDALHRESVRLGNFHVAPVCTPTRSELMTGLYALRNKASTVPSARNWMRRDIVTIPETFWLMDTLRDYSVSGVLGMPIPTGPWIVVSCMQFGTKAGDWHQKTNTTMIITTPGIWMGMR